MSLIFPQFGYNPSPAKDIGALFSHAAIISSELGILAVVGCGNATLLLKTGDHVCVDGEHGTVAVLSR